MMKPKTIEENGWGNYRVRTIREGVLLQVEPLAETISM